LCENWVEMTRAQRQVDNIGDCGDDDRSTFFQEPGGDRIRITLLIRTVEQDLKDFRFRGRLKNREIRRSYRW